MDAEPNLARIAALIGDRARAEILMALMSGQALTATELAAVAGITKQTVSTHLARLLDARLLAVERQGRHRYFRLGDRDVALLLEQLMGMASRLGILRAHSGPPEPALRKARVCYDHLAGELGVLVFDSLEQRRFLHSSGAELNLTEPGRQFCLAIGIDLAALERQRRPLCRACLDWSVRRHHLAGGLGAAILSQCLDLRWARRAKGSRVVTFSAVGEKALREQFRLPVAQTATGSRQSLPPSHRPARSPGDAGRAGVPRTEDDVTQSGSVWT